MVHFQGTEYRSHTSCVSEAQKYQGHLYREKDKKSKRRSMNGYDNSQAMVPRKAYVEDAPDGDESQQAIAVIDVPPKAPTPPPAAGEPVRELPENVNVFDFLVSEETPNGDRPAIEAPQRQTTMEHSTYYGNGDSQYSQYSNGDGSQYTQYGFSYGSAPIPPDFSRYDSWSNLAESQQQALMPPPYVTPAPKEHRKERKDVQTTEKSDKKRKRHAVEELDLSSMKRPSSRDATMIDAQRSGGRVLHSGLTGGLNKLVTDPEFFEDRIDAGPTPILSPLKRTRREDKEEKKDRRKSVYTSYGTTTSSKPSSSRHGDDRHRESQHHRSRSAERSYHDDRHHRARKPRESFSSDDRSSRAPRKHLKAIDYPREHPSRTASVQPTATNQLVSYRSRGDLFMSFITKGPDSERGCSINKVLKRYHRERDVRGEEKEDEDKELWKSLRLRKNDRGEIVLFI